MPRILPATAVTLALALASTAHAAVTITEVAPWASGNAPYGADWFELTNTGTTAVDIRGWRFDDNSNAFASSVALQGITSIGAGQSVIFVEGSSASAGAFASAWFGAAVPAGLRIGTYGGSGIGLSTGGDAVNLFDAGGVLQSRVAFGASDAQAPFQTFDNAAGANAVTLTQWSVAGVRGAFTSVDGTEIGSPGTIAAVPEPETYALLLAGLGLVAGAARRRGASRRGASQ